MEAERFDALSRSWATRTSRRTAVGRIGTGGVLAGLAASLGLGRNGVLAQSDETKSCTFVLQALTTAGPGADDEWAGEIQMDIGPDGEIDSGVYTDDDDNEFDLVGQATGRALNLRIKLDEGYLTLIGTAQQDVVQCRGGLEGVFSGPELGDTGSWRGSRKRNTAKPTPVPTPAPTIASGGGDSGGSGGDSGGGSGGDSGGGSGGGDTEPTPDGHCPLNYVECGPETCCPGGAICDSADSCHCPENTEICGDFCVEVCPSGQMRANDSCDCVDAAPPPTPADNCAPGMADCGTGCIDVVNDVNNCGFCGNVCPAKMPCIAGSCLCPPDWVYCGPADGCKAAC